MKVIHLKLAVQEVGEPFEGELQDLSGLVFQAVQDAIGQSFYGSSDGGFMVRPIRAWLEDTEKEKAMYANDGSVPLADDGDPEFGKVSESTSFSEKRIVEAIRAAHERTAKTVSGQIAQYAANTFAHEVLRLLGLTATRSVAVTLEFNIDVPVYQNVTYDLVAQGADQGPEWYKEHATWEDPLTPE